jgi:hypothetical protein
MLMIIPPGPTASMTSPVHDVTGLGRRCWRYPEEVGTAGQIYGIGNKDPDPGILLRADIRVADFHVEGGEPARHLVADPAKPEHPRPLAMDPAGKREHALPRPIARSNAGFAGDDRVRMGEHHRDAEVCHVPSEDVERVGHADPTQAAGREIDGIEADPVGRDDLEASIIPRLAPSLRDAPYRGPDLGEIGVLIGGIEVSPHVERLSEGSLVPSGQGPDLKHHRL